MYICFDLIYIGKGSVWWGETGQERERGVGWGWEGGGERDIDIFPILPVQSFVTVPCGHMSVSV